MTTVVLRFDGVGHRLTTVVLCFATASLVAGRDRLDAAAARGSLLG